jgi:hypothetical protein
MAYSGLRAALSAVGMLLLLGIGAAQAQGLQMEEYLWQTDYADLKDAERQAMATMGWDEENWDSETVADDPQTELVEWSGLNMEQQGALTSLGYTAETWNATRPRRPASDPAAFWAQQTDWSALRPAERAFWEQLGSDETNWGGGLGGRTWADLNGDQRAAADRLGFDQASWDAAAKAQ